VPAHELADLITNLSSEEVVNNPMLMKDERTKLEIDFAAEKNAFNGGSMKLGELSPYTCPECHGVLSRIKDGGLIRFRCHTGHAYSVDSLMTSLTAGIEDSLYGAIRGIEESIFLLNHMGDHYAED